MQTIRSSAWPIALAFILATISAGLYCAGQAPAVLHALVKAARPG